MLRKRFLHFDNVFVTVMIHYSIVNALYKKAAPKAMLRKMSTCHFFGSKTIAAE
jgi:hypothetical protein